ncbi:Na+/H+ antiporter subunit E [Chloroflexales bacterium ZM16-3]|nr:Na+/H+ antiporter subunit E [Chloroflexales bacterium ZM16-3]
MLVLNLTLAIVWMVLQTSFTWPDFVVGMAVGFAIIGVSEPALRPQHPDLSVGRARTSYVSLTLRAISLVSFMIVAIIKSNLDVARIVLNPRHVFRPGIVGVPLDVQSDSGITLLAIMVTITPGTVALDVSSDRHTMYIHAIDVRDAAALRDEIKNEFERRVMEIFP